MLDLDHFWVASATAMGWRRITTNDAIGNNAWRKRVRTRFGGDFSNNTGRDRSQWGVQVSNTRRALSEVASGDSSVTCAFGSNENLPGPPWARAVGSTFWLC